MPSKILIWNIQNFTLNKIDWTIGDIVEYYGTQNPTFYAAYNTLRNDYIISNIELENPDIFIVIEVISGRGAKGSLVSGRGAMGVTTLLSRMRRLNKNWCLVPPLKLTAEIQVGEIEDDNDQELLQLLSEGGYTEGIGVFFRSDRVDFVGPYIWPNQPGNDNAGKTSVPFGTATPAAYPEEWQSCLPQGNYYAGQFEYKVTGHEKFFPAETSRRPFFTKFQEKTGMNRFLSIFSVHFPPKENSAVAALTTLGEYLKDNYVVANNEILMIVGDYNINPCNENVTSLKMPLEGTGLVPLLTCQSGVDSTIFYSNSYATPNLYYKANKVLDNVAVKFGSRQIFQDLNIGVVNRVANSSILYTPLNVIKSLPTPERQNEVFRHPSNFKKIGPNPGTSDHLPVSLIL